MVDLYTATSLVLTHFWYAWVPPIGVADLDWKKMCSPPPLPPDPNPYKKKWLDPDLNPFHRLSELHISTKNCFRSQILFTISKRPGIYRLIYFYTKKFFLKSPDDAIVIFLMPHDIGKKRRLSVVYIIFAFGVESQCLNILYLEICFIWIWNNIIMTKMRF